MATKEQIEYLLGKAILNPEFRENLLLNPEEAAKSLRIELTAAQSASIQRLDNNLVNWWSDGLTKFRPDDQAYFW